MKSKKMKIILMVSIAVVILAVMVLLGIRIFRHIEENNALELVQNGYMGSYDTVTTKEVMEDFPKDRGSQKWTVETKEINGENRILVNFSFNDNTVIKFLPAKDNKTYKVFAIETDGKKIEAKNFPDEIFSMYVNYMQRFPDKGVNALIDIDKDSDVGRNGKIQKIKNGPLYKTDVQDYIDKLCFKSTTDRLKLREVELDDIMGDKSAYQSEEGNLYIHLEDTNIEMFDDENATATVTMTIEGSKNMSPAFYGVRLGDKIDWVKKELTSEGYVLKDDVQEDRRINECEFIDDKGSKVFIRYRTNTNKIYSIVYSEDIKVIELKKFGYEHAKFINDTENIESSSDAKVSQYIFPDSNSKYLSEEEVRGVETDKLFVGRNEIFARHGYIFEDEGLQQHFGNTSWYKGTVQGNQFNADEVFNDFEKKNVELIKKIEDEVNGVTNQFIGLTGVYICTTPEMDGLTGKIEILGIGDNSIQYSLGSLEMPNSLATGEAQIIDGSTAQAKMQGFTFTLSWSDAENLYVTNEGELTGMDSGTIMSITDGMTYTRPTEFN